MRFIPNNFKNPAEWIPLLLASGVVALVWSQRGKQTQAPPSSQPQPLPPGQLDLLLQQATQLIQRAQTAPATADPIEMDRLASQLEAAGRPNEAAALRVWAEHIRIQRGGLPLPPPAGTGTPPPMRDATLVEFDQVMLQAVRGPNTVNLTEAARLVERLRAAGFTSEAGELQTTLDRLRAVLIQQRGTALPR